jgi:exopolysaccharide biosynthesis polyprenyl glycosylphosphotransferase
MKAKKHKFLLLLLLQGSVFAILIAIVNIIIQLTFHESRFQPKVTIVLAILFFAYFFQMWKSVYSRDYHYYLKNIRGIVVRNALTPALLSLVIFFLLRIDKSDAPLPSLIYFCTGALSFPVAQECQFIWIGYLSSLGYFKKNLIIVGSPNGGNPSSFMRGFGSTKHYMGEIVKRDEGWMWNPAQGTGLHRVNGFSEIRTIIMKHNIGDLIIFTGNPMEENLISQIIAYCQAISISYYIVPDVRRIPKKHPAIPLFPYLPVFERYSGSRDSLTAVTLKRILDITISMWMLVVFLPIALLISAAIKLGDGGPVFYTSRRIGKNGKPMRFYKFRTMSVGADAQKRNLLSYNERSDGPLFKMSDDPRVTTIGKLLRWNNLDELPQILNVLVGNMSLIGPRPHLPEEVSNYAEEDYLRLECMPGIVGLPQVSGPNTMRFRKSVDLDLEYRRKWSLALDLKIIGKTAKMSISGVLREFRSILFGRIGS